MSKKETYLRWDVRIEFHDDGFIMETVDAETVDKALGYIHSAYDISPETVRSISIELVMQGKE